MSQVVSLKDHVISISCEKVYFNLPFVLSLSFLCEEVNIWEEHTQSKHRISYHRIGGNLKKCKCSVSKCQIFNQELRRVHGYL